MSRLGVFGRLAGGVAGGMVAEGARRLADGERPRMRDLLMTPANAGRLADRLSHLRGAAMKMGQMISMDAGDMLPPELSDILARLRQNASHMPPAQLQTVLSRAWGKDWRTRFRRFSATPIAAASIGQVHRATGRDGRELAIKIQYPGVAESIDADVDNVATLLRIANLLPRELPIDALLVEAKRQLHEEADYRREGAQMERFAALLAGDDRYVLPTLDHDFTTDRVLAMSYEEGEAVETLEAASQEDRDAAMRALIALVLRELFDFGVMQTDPNFANYRYRPSTRQLVLLDFGAARDVDAGTSGAYLRLLTAGLASEGSAVRHAAVETGFLGEVAVDRHRTIIDNMIAVILEQLNKDAVFDFGDRSFVGALRDQATTLIEDRATWHLPPVDTLFVQRKISGTALLAARLKARIDIRTMVERYHSEPRSL